MKITIPENTKSIFYRSSAHQHCLRVTSTMGFYMIFVVFFLISFGSQALNTSLKDSVAMDLLRSEISYPEMDLKNGNIVFEKSLKQPVVRLKVAENGNMTPFIRLSNFVKLDSAHYYQLIFQMRTIPSDGKDVGQGGIQITFGGFPKLGSIDRTDIDKQTVVVVGKEWESFNIDLIAGRDYNKKEARIEFTPKFFNETIEIKEVYLVKRGKEKPDAVSGIKGYNYIGQSPNSEWRKDANMRIEKHRKSDMNFTVLDEWGKPLEGVSVEVRMKKHNYLFGTCAKAIRIIDGDFNAKGEEFDHTKLLEDNRIYREKLKELFNFVVLENDLKWTFWSGEKVNSTQKGTMDALKWLKENDLVAKGHTMMWGSWRQSPKYLEEQKNNAEAIRTIARKHIEDQSYAMENWVAYADVLNEPNSHNDMIDLLGWEEIAEWFKIAKGIIPETKLVINDFDILGNGGSKKVQNAHETLIRKLLNQGAPIDVLGFQSHFWSTRLTEPEKLYTIIDRFAQIGLPLMVSEFDMNMLDEKLQADYTRDFMTVWFSHPSTEAFIMWGFWGKAHWFGEPGAMYLNDWTPKPNLAVYKELLFKEWWTNIDLLSNQEGEVSSRGFHGEYEIVFSKEGRKNAVRYLNNTSEGIDISVIMYPER